MGRTAAPTPAATVQRRRRLGPSPVVRLSPANDGHDEIRHGRRRRRRPAIAFVGPVPVAHADRVPERRRRLRRLRWLRRLHGRLRRRRRWRLRVAGGARGRGGARRGAAARGEKGPDQGGDRAAPPADRGQRPAARGAVAPGPDPRERRARVLIVHAAVAISRRYIYVRRDTHIIAITPTPLNLCVRTQRVAVGGDARVACDRPVMSAHHAYMCIGV